MYILPKGMEIGIFRELKYNVSSKGSWFLAFFISYLLAFKCFLVFSRNLGNFFFICD